MKESKDTAPATLLNPVRQELLDHVRSALGDLYGALADGLVGTTDEATVRASIDHLDDPFLLVVVGEFNAGKSALVNALAGERILQEGVTPTTNAIQILRHVDHPGHAPGDGVRTVVGRAPILRDIHLVDTPGTNAIAREHEAVTERFVPRADLILFTTSADRPFTESERAFMERIREWGKKIVVVVNKLDIVASPSELTDVISYVRTSAQHLLAFTPEVFAVSARQAFESKTGDDADLLEKSGLPALEQYVLTTLDDNERFRLKLLTPVGVGLRFVKSGLAAIATRREVIQDDVTVVDDVRSMLTGYERELERGLELRLTEIDNVLHEVERKGNNFFDETLRLVRIADLLNRSKLRADFEREVVGSLAHDIESKVEALIDWLIASDLQLWQGIRERLVERQTAPAERVAGRLATGFEYNRQQLLGRLGSTVRETLDRHDHRAESARLADSVQSAVAGAALLEVGAVGLGTVLTMLASSTVVDITGTLAAGMAATLGFLVIPRRRRGAKANLHERLATLRAHLARALTAQCKEEVATSVKRIEGVLSPYLQWVEGERTRIEERAGSLRTVDERLKDIRRRLEGPSGAQSG